ncbi:MAG: hypothetical protein P4N59_14470 [Negativicutes bacterium]|nr:hypothetical protein [Negativicutes bacterium]
MSGEDNERATPIWLAKANIARFQEQLKTVEDYSARRMLEFELASEEDKLAKLLDQDKP